MKKAKLWVELIFIFALPLIFMVLCFSFKTVNTYDVNNNLLTSQKVLDVNDVSFLRDYNDNIPYINTLKFNQIYGSNNDYNFQLFSYSKDTNLITLNGSTSSFFDVTSFPNNSVLPESKVFIHFKVVNGSFTGGNPRIMINGSGYYSLGLLDNETDKKDIINYIAPLSGHLYFYIDSNGVFNDLKLEITVIDLTRMFGRGFEPSTLNELSNYIDIEEHYGYTLEEDIIYYSVDQVSEFFVYNYTWYTAIFNNLFNSLQLEYNIILQIVITYTILWFIMFIIWHLFYLPFDFLMHLCRKE